MRAAVIDIGSSSIKLIIGEKHDDQFKVLETIKNEVPMGKHAFFRGKIPQEIINQSVSILERYCQTIKEYDVSDVRVIATTAVREARNKDIFVDTVLRKTGLTIEVLNVGDVVYYLDSYLPHKLTKTYPIHEKNILIGELGAGSLDVSIMEKGFTLMNTGFPLGTLMLKQFMSKLDGSKEEVYEALGEYIENELFSLRRVTPKLPIDDIILIDENYSVYLQEILPNKKRPSDFFQLKAKEAAQFLERMTNPDQGEALEIFKISPESMDMVVGYAMILNTLFKLTKNEYIYILEISLSEAVLANSLLNFEALNSQNKTKQLISVATFLCRRYNADLEHVKQVAFLSESLFKQLKDFLGVQDKDLLYLLLAAYLHDIGIFINSRGHHKHSEYVINSLALFRLTEEEIKMIACIARYHRRSPPLKAHTLFYSLALEHQILVQKLSALLRIANALDRSHRQKVEKLDVQISRKQDVSIIVHTKSNFILEKAQFSEIKELFEEITGNKLSLSVLSKE